MLKLIWTLTGLLAISGSTVALTQSEMRTKIEDNYPNAVITEIEKERYQGGGEIYEIDFQHEGIALEAIISLEGKLIHVEIDD
ncbi:MAG: hypothetical protein ACI845_001532 [Gammaproteobacteria bacterium]|jgi:hypothetical protein